MRALWTFLVVASRPVFVSAIAGPLMVHDLPAGIATFCAGMVWGLDANRRTLDEFEARRAGWQQDHGATG